MPSTSEDPVPEWLKGTVETIFSWVILLPIAVIISGKILAKVVEFQVDSEQVFKIPIKILNIEAKNGEVILGFTGFIITLTGLAIVYGQNIYLIVKTNFGIDPGQFNALCMFSSFSTVIWSTLIFFISKLFYKYNPDKQLSNILKEHELLINKLADTKHSDDSDGK